MRNSRTFHVLPGGFRDETTPNGACLSSCDLSWTSPEVLIGLALGCQSGGFLALLRSPLYSRYIQDQIIIAEDVPALSHSFLAKANSCDMDSNCRHSCSKAVEDRALSPRIIGERFILCPSFSRIWQIIMHDLWLILSQVTVFPLRRLSSFELSYKLYCSKTLH